MPAIATAELLASLAHLPDEASVTVTVPVGELRRAIETRAGGPKELTTVEAAQYLGRTPEFWNDAAKAGQIDGAYRDRKGGRWRLPRGACEAHLRARQQRGRQSTRRSRAVLPFDGARARGPRKKAVSPAPTP